MGKIQPMSGNFAVATGVKLSRVKVIAAYPITPSSTIVEYLSEFVANGELDAEYIEAEGEHGMVGEAIGACATGCRTFTATCSLGFAYGYENISNVPGFRLPIVMGIANRPIGWPGTIHCDHSDSMSNRDFGWMQFYVETAQEALDTVIQAYRIGEDKRVILPSMVCEDGFYLSHTTELVNVPDQKEVDEFLPPYKPGVTLDPDNPARPMTIDPPQNIPSLGLMAMKYAMEEAQQRAKAVIKEVNEEFAKQFGRRYGNGLVEEYMLDDAEAALVVMGSFSGNAKVAVKNMRSGGKRIGLIRVRTFRPFPVEELQRLGKNLKALAVISRATSLGGADGVLGYDVKSAFMNQTRKPVIVSFVAGLLGNEVGVKDFEYLGERALEAAAKGSVEKDVEWYPEFEIEEVAAPPPSKAESLERLTVPGTAACQGCGMVLAFRTILETLGRNTIFALSAGCGAWASTDPSKSGYAVPSMLLALPAGAALASGISRGLKAQGKTGVNVVLFTGDGSFGDMGFMSGSGAAERNEDILIFCYDNEAYMNTGIQRSGTTPFRAWTTTTPVGSVRKGKGRQKKDLAAIMAAHKIPYVATASPAYLEDLQRKLKKAISIHGCKYIHFISPCPTGHRYPTEKAIEVTRLAVRSGLFPLYEIEGGKFRLTMKPKERVPVSEYLKIQGRFRHLTEQDIAEIQKETDEAYAEYERMDKEGIA